MVLRRGGIEAVKPSLARKPKFPLNPGHDRSVTNYYVHTIFIPHLTPFSRTKNIERRSQRM